MNQNNDQKLIENKKPKKNTLIILLIIIIIFFLSLLILSVYFWTDFQKNYIINEEYIEELKVNIEDSFNKKYNLVNSSQFQKYDNLSKSVIKLSEKMSDIENEINENQKNNDEILSYLSNLNEKLEGLELQLKNKLQNDNQSKIINPKKSVLPKNNFDLNSIIKKLNNEFKDNIPWNQTLIEIYNSKSKEFLTRFSNDLKTLHKYSLSPPPTLKALKDNFESLIPSILKFLPNEDDNFISEKINWIIKSIKLRRAGITEGNNPYDLISNIEYHLNNNNLNGVVENFYNLPDQMQKPALKWLNDLNSRFEINDSANNILQNYRNYIK